MNSRTIAVDFNTSASVSVIPDPRVVYLAQRKRNDFNNDLYTFREKTLATE